MTWALIAAALALAAAWTAPPASAQSPDAPPAEAACPAPPDREAERRALMRALKVAPGPVEARRVTAALWDVWTDAPDEVSQTMLDQGMGAIRRGDLMLAVAVLGALVERCPDFAEGWNQRAFALYLAGRHGPALEDLDRALTLSPEHLGALSGRALALRGLGREAEAQEALRRAARLNPWLPERDMIEGGPEIDL